MAPDAQTSCWLREYHPRFVGKCSDILHEAWDWRLESGNVMWSGTEVRPFNVLVIPPQHMEPTSNSLVAGMHDIAEDRSRFRAHLAVEASLARAGRSFFQKTGDAALTCHEMLREHLTTVFTATEADLNATYDISTDDGIAARDRARIELALQRAALLMRKSDLLHAIVNKDDALVADIMTDRARLDSGEISDEERREIEEGLKVAWICRADLARLARIVVEQRAMQEVVASMGITNFGQKEMETLIEAAESRTALIEEGLQQGAPLRRVLATDLALEASRLNERAPSRLPYNSRTSPSRSASRAR